MTTQEERDEEMAFEQAFDSTVAEPTFSAPAADKVAEPQTPAKTAQPIAADTPAVDEPEKTPAQEPDPFASLPPAVRDLLAAIPAMRAEQERLTRMANMVPALQSRIDKMSQAPAPVTETPSAPAAPGRFAKVEAIRRELPEIADALDEIANDRHPAPAPPQTPPPQAPPPDATNPHEDALTSVRPQWADDLTSNDFQLWLVRQPREFQAQVQNTNKAGEILAALGKFDAFKAQTTSTQHLQQSRTTRMAAAVTPQGDGRRQRVAATPEDEEDAAFKAAFNNARGRH